MDVEVTIKMTIKDVPKEVIALGCSATKDCLKIMMSGSLAKDGYGSDIDNITIHSVSGNA